MDAEYARLSVYNPLAAHLFLPIFDELTDPTRRWRIGPEILGQSKEYEIPLHISPRSDMHNVYCGTAAGEVYVDFSEYGNHLPRVSGAVCKNPVQGQAIDELSLFADVLYKADESLRKLMTTPEGTMLLRQYMAILEGRGKVLQFPYLKSA